MRRFELLVSEVRDGTDTADRNSVKTYEIMRYFNDAQKQIQKIIFAANSSADIFTKPFTYEIAGSSEKAHDLPWDIYAYSSITSLHTESSGTKISKLANTERAAIFGYSLIDKQIVLSFNPQENFVLNYVYKLPIMSYRLGKITNIDTGTGIVTIDATTIQEDEGFVEKYDNYSIVSSIGANTANRLELVSYAGTEFTFTGDLSTAVVGNYIVCGENGTSHSLLPDECEPYLMAYVQRRILNKIASTEVQGENIFTIEEKEDLSDLFKDNSREILHPVSSDTDYLGF